MSDRGLPHEPPFDPEYDNAQPPQNIDAERAVLGALILDPKTAPTLAAELDAADFYRPAHETIYAAAQDLAASSTPLDPITLADRLTKSGELQRIGGAPYLHDLIAAVPITANATYYAGLVRDAARLRQIGDVATSLRQIVSKATPDKLESAFTYAYERLDEAAARLGPRNVTGPTQWAPLDLEPVLAGGEIDPPPNMLRRTDGQFLLYESSVHTISGEPASGKTWLTLLACVQQLTAGNPTTMIDFEDRASRVIGRLLALGAHPDQVRENFRYIRPHSALDSTSAKDLDRAVSGCKLVIIDGVTEAMTLHGLDLNANPDAAKFYDLLPRRIADHGPGVAMIDHVVKDPEKQGRWALGAQHKLAGIDGVAYTVKAVESFGRGKIGHARITAGKDRAGHVEEILLGRTAAELWLDATAPLMIIAELRPAVSVPTDDAGNMRPTRLMERVSRYIEITPGLGKRELIDGRISGKGAYLKRAIDRLLQEGYIEVEAGANNKQSHRSITPFRADEEETPS